MYAGGLAAWRNFLPDTLTDNEVMAIRDAWRRLHTNIVKFWYRLNRAALFAVKHPGELARCGMLDLWSTGSFLFLQLPSKRLLSYPYPSIIKNSFGEDAVVYRDNSAGQFVLCRFGQGAHPGIWFQNAVQACARDVMAEAMLRIDAAGHQIVLHVHDEVVIETAKGTVDLNSFTRLMTRKPRWALNLPLAAETTRNTRYIKT